MNIKNRINSFIYFWIILTFKKDDFITLDQVIRRCEVITMALCQRQTKDDYRNELIKEKEIYYNLWLNYSKEHRKYRKEWKKLQLEKRIKNGHTNSK